MNLHAMYAILLALGLGFTAPAVQANSLEAQGQGFKFEDLFRQSSLNEFGAKILEKAADLDVRASMNVFDLALTEGVGISAKYNYGVQRGYQPDLHVRTDAWRLRGNVDIGDILRDAVDENLPIYLKLERDAEVVYLRQFPTKKQAIKASPYVIKQLPITAARALQHLKVGDMASIPTRMNIAMGARFGSDMSYVKAGVTRAYVLRGNFTVQVFRASENVLRVRVFTRASKGDVSEAHGRINLETFGIEEVESLVKRVVRLELFQLSQTKDKGEVLLFDYLFDTNYAEARNAYDQILNSTLQFKDAQLVRQFVTGNEIQPLYFSSMNDANEISFADRNSNTPRVRRLAMVENRYTQDSSMRRWGLLLAGWRQELNYLENSITLTDREGNIRNFFNPSFVRFERSDIGLNAGGAKSETRKTIYSILDSNPQGTNMSLYNLGVVHDQNESSFNKSEQERLRNTLIATLPQGVFDSVNWKDWGWNDSTKRASTRDRAGSRVIFQVSLKASVLPLLKRYTQAEIYGRVRPQLDAAYRKANSRQKDQVAQSIAANLFRAVNDASLSDKDKVGLLMELRRSEAFTKIGLGFITALISRAELEQHGYMTFQMFSQQAQEVKFTLGTPDPNEIDRIVRDIDLVLDDRNVDPSRFLPGSGALD